METFTVEELAKYLKLHEYTIRRLARDGKVPSFKAGGQWRFRRDEINKWSKSYPFAHGSKKFEGQ